MVVKVERKKVLAWLCLFFIALAAVTIYRYIDFYNEKKTDINSTDAVQASSINLESFNYKQDFFIEYRLERDRLRAEQAEVLQEDLKTATADEERRELRSRLLELFNEKKLETDMENMIRAKGFEDAVVICRADNANAIVKKDTLVSGDVIQIADVIKRLGNIREENIVISSK